MGGWADCPSLLQVGFEGQEGAADCGGFLGEAGGRDRDGDGVVVGAVAEADPEGGNPGGMGVEVLGEASLADVSDHRHEGGQVHGFAPGRPFGGGQLQHVLVGQGGEAGAAVGGGGQWEGFPDGGDSAQAAGTFGLIQKDHLRPAQDREVHGFAGVAGQRGQMRAAAVGHVDPGGAREGMERGPKADALGGADQLLGGQRADDPLDGGTRQVEGSGDLAEGLAAGIGREIAQNRRGAGDDLNAGFWIVHGDPILMRLYRSLVRIVGS